MAVVEDANSLSCHLGHVVKVKWIEATKLVSWEIGQEPKQMHLA